MVALALALAQTKKKIHKEVCFDPHKIFWTINENYSHDFDFSKKI